MTGSLMDLKLEDEDNLTFDVNEAIVIRHLIEIVLVLWFDEFFLYKMSEGKKTIPTILRLGVELLLKSITIRNLRGRRVIPINMFGIPMRWRISFHIEKVSHIYCQQRTEEKVSVLVFGINIMIIWMQIKINYEFL